MQQFAAIVQHPWLLTGDFNDAINLNERNHGGIEMLRRCDTFKHWTENNSLIGLGFSGPKFTWMRGNSSTTTKCVRLDGALSNIRWRAHFEEGAVQHLVQGYSDRLLLLIGTRDFLSHLKGPKPFWFQVAWISHEGFDAKVEGH